MTVTNIEAVANNGHYKPVEGLTVEEQHRRMAIAEEQLKELKAQGVKFIKWVNIVLKVNSRDMATECVVCGHRFHLFVCYAPFFNGHHEEWLCPSCLDKVLPGGSAALAAFNRKINPDYAPPRSEK